MGLRHALVIAALVTATACSASGEDSASPTTTAGDDASCDAVEELLVAMDALDSPEVFELAADEVPLAYEERRAAVADLAELVDDRASREALNSLGDDLAISDPALVGALVDNHDVVEDIGGPWEFVVLNSAAVTVDQREAFFRASEGGWPIGRVRAKCLKPQLLADPPEDRQPTVEGGTILYDTIGGADGGLRAVSTSGGPTTEVHPPDGWDDLDEPTVGPDGRTVVAIARRGGDAPAVGVAIGNVEDGFTIAYETTDADLTCPRIADDGEILVTALGSGGRPNVLRSVRDDGAAADLDLPVAEFYCAERLPDAEILLGSATDDHKERGGVAVVEASLADSETIFEPKDCNSLITGLSSDSQTELVVQTCDELDQSGMFALDIATGDAEHIIDWPSAAARWSPSGEWITFGLINLGGPSAETVRVWLVRSDGSGLRRLTDVPSSFPAWVSDELG